MNQLPENNWENFNCNKQNVFVLGLIRLFNLNDLLIFYSHPSHGLHDLFVTIKQVKLHENH